MKYSLIFNALYPRDVKHALIFSNDDYRGTFDDRDGDRWLTPAETAAYLLGAPASSFPVEAPKDEELPS